MADKQKFMNDIIIYCDTREQKNAHILEKLDTWGIRHESKKLDFGDYSFSVGDKDFRMNYAVERKANISELWGNVTKGRARFEKEISAMHSITNAAHLIIENCPSRDFLKAYKVDDATMKYQNRKVQEIGKIIDNTLQAWGSSNRYGLTVHYVQNPADTAGELLAMFYYQYHNYRELIKPIKK